jgi:hypothetical protein
MIQPFAGKLFALAVSLLLLGVYWPGLEGPFLADDYPNFVHNPYVAIDELSVAQILGALSSNQSGPLGRPLPALSFTLNYWFAGQSFDNLHFKMFNLVVHVINAGLAFLLVRSVIGAWGNHSARSVFWTAAAVSALWALHPIQLTNVLYVVQRINSMAGLFMLAGLVMFCSGRRRLMNGEPLAWPMIMGGVGGGAVLGALCKENAVLLPALAAVLECTVFRLRASTALDSRRLAVMTVVVGVAPYVVGAVYVLGWTEVWANRYAYRDFDMVERVLTQGRVGWWYVAQIFAPDVQQLTFFHDDVQPSRGWLSPVGTLFSWFGWALAVVVAVVTWRATPWIALGVAWFLVGHAMEGTVVPLELVYEHRNYIPSLGLLIATGALARMAFERAGLGNALRAGIAVAALAGVSATTFVQASVWADGATLVRVLAERNPRSARLQVQLAAVLEVTTGDLRAVYAAHARADELDPNRVFAKLHMLRLLAFISYANELRGADGGSPISDYQGRVVQAVDSASIAQATATFSADIVRLLHDRPLGVGPVASVREMVECIETGRQECVRLAPHVEKFADAVLNSEHATIGQRQAFMWLRARLRLALGKPESVMAIMDEAVALNPGYLQLRFQRAALAVSLGEKELARRYIARLGDDIVTARGRLKLEKLERMLAQ